MMKERSAIVSLVVLILCTSAAAQTTLTCTTPFQQELTSIGEIRSDADHVLRGVIDVKEENRTFIDYSGAPATPYICTTRLLRSYHGYRGLSLDPKNLVTRTGIASPGPNLRAAVGDKVQLILFNHVDITQFALTSATGQGFFGEDCDSSISASTGKQNYPARSTANPENYPNCFHASNTANIHYHGTHVSPDGFGDNVLVSVLPNKNLDDAATLRLLADSFTRPDMASRLQAAAASGLDAMRTTASVGNNAVLTKQLDQVIAANAEAKMHGQWPQYWPGWYPTSFTLPVDPGALPSMGQAPGTHWYHSHQHGSTSVQLLGGMSGLFIITGDYDDKLLRLGGGTPDKPKIKEKVMIFQKFSDQVNLINARPVATLIEVNGQALPKVTMKKGEVQWWRMANGTISQHGEDRFLFLTKAQWDDLAAHPAKLQNGTYPGGGRRPAEPPPRDASAVPTLWQTANDGVQFTWDQFNAQKDPLQFLLAPGTRVDALVKAPATEGEMYLVTWTPRITDRIQSGPPASRNIQSLTILKVVVSGNPTDENTKLPTQAEFPVRPGFLEDITAADTNERHRALTFAMQNGPGGAAPFAQFTIDGKKFSEGTVDQIMLLGQTEEWTLYNTSLVDVMHPFHIHVNPFQVVEVYDPAAMDKPEVKAFPLWRDTIAIPAGLQDPKGTFTDPQGRKINPGYVKIRSRFVDFPGSFVLHCHILGHEDRGMMQLIQIIDNHTSIKHH
jgi:FtsP/CotA-like multicopper oxidase with cupredoxin domain